MVPTLPMMMRRAWVSVSQTNTRFGIWVSGVFSSLSTEMYAIRQALRYIHGSGVDKVVILTDSLSCINMILNRIENWEREGIVFEIVNSVIGLMSRNWELVIVRIPAHVGLKGEIEADRLAEIGRCLTMRVSTRPYREDIRRVIEARVDIRAGF